METSPGSYVEIRRPWRSGDTLNMNLPMPVRRVECHPYVTENTRRVALMRGPLLYCVEQADNHEVDLRNVILEDAGPAARYDPELLGGVTVLQAEARIAAPEVGWEDRLYRTVHPGEGGTRTDAGEITFVPYYTWATREPGAMRVWIRSG